MTKGYQRENTSIHLMNYHFVWCPKYRRKLLVGEIKKRLLELINEKAKELKCKILTIEIMPDHTHLFIQGNPSLSANYVIGQIKGKSSKILRDEFPFLRKKHSNIIIGSNYCHRRLHKKSYSICKEIIILGSNQERKTKVQIRRCSE